MSKSIRNVLIVGGGTSGWMTAAYLQRALPAGVNITLVESDRVPTIGVGEATFSTIKLFFDYLGLEERDWMPECNASYKMAIRFSGWNAAGRDFYHPFQRYETVDGFSLAEWWLRLHKDKPFDQMCFSIPQLCENKRSPRFLDGEVFDPSVQHAFQREHIDRKNTLGDHKIQYPYAYHFDASLLARFLMKRTVTAGVRHILDDVTNVGLRADGAIGHVQTQNNGALEADLYIDCTGFAGLLINKALGTPFISFNDTLLCDRAVAMQVPEDIEAEGIRPYTSATALSAGWVWNIPLYGRKGTGYVYSSRFATPEQAEAELRAHLGPAAEGLKANHIRMRIGRSENAWVKNCVAIGLSSGFVEPLESTGIFFIQHGIEQLVSHFPDLSFNPSLIRSYNRGVGECIDGVRDFLTLHYYASTRADTPFWKATKEIAISPALADRLALWKHRLPDAMSVNPAYHGFEAYSYSVMLLGLGYVPEGPQPAVASADPTRAEAAFAQVRARTHALTTRLPSVVEYLTHVAEARGELTQGGARIYRRPAGPVPDEARS
ncbi:MAG: tryptophan halogenase family protein [Myxococcota bacterium]